MLNSEPEITLVNSSMEWKFSYVTTVPNSSDMQLPDFIAQRVLRAEPI
jgi:hypothetical protein